MINEVVVPSVVVITVDVVDVVFTVFSGVDVIGIISRAVAATVKTGIFVVVVISCLTFGVSIVWTTVVVVTAGVLIGIVVDGVVVVGDVVVVVVVVVVAIHRNPPGVLIHTAPRVIQSSMPSLHSSMSLQFLPSPL